MKVLPKKSQLNDHTTGFHLQTQNLELHFLVQVTGAVLHRTWAYTFKLKHTHRSRNQAHSFENVSVMDRLLYVTITPPLAWNFRLRPYNSKNTDPNETWGHRHLVCGFKSRPDGVVPLLVKLKSDLSFRILSVLVLFLALLLHMNCFVSSCSFDFVGQAKRSWNKKNQNSLQFCSFQENENQNSRAPIL